MIEELIQGEKCDIIVASSLAFGEDMKKAAAEYPNVYFLHAAGMGEAAKLSSFFGRMYQARDLAGIVAGMETTNG